jgi:hypothetical protein
MKRPSSALVVASLALFVAIGGVATGATRYLITSTKQISPGVLKKVEKAGPRGVRGATGAKGAAGATGMFNAANVTVVNGPAASITGNQAALSVATCPTGDTAISGGFVTTGLANVSVEGDGPGIDQGWDVDLQGPSTSASGSVQTGTFYAQAVCASPGLVANQYARRSVDGVRSGG